MNRSNAKRIAVIGTGISGLVAAEQLHQTHDVTIFEADNRVGGHTNTIKVDLDGRHYRVDTGFIVYNEKNYPRFTKLLARLDVATKPTSMSFSVRDDAADLEYNGTSLNKLFAQRRNLVRPSFLRMLREIGRFNRDAPLLLDQPADGGGPTVADYLQKGNYSSEFVAHYLVPLGTALWSVPSDLFRAFPMRFVVAFLQNHCMLQVGGRPQWRVVDGGSREYVKKLISGFHDRISLSTPIESVRRTDVGVQLRTGQGDVESFDHVVIACHADQALRMLTDSTQNERDVLSAFPYQPNTAILHTDASVLPHRKRAWASWNARLPQREGDGIAVTYNMNMLQSITSEHTFCVTLNEQSLIDKSKIIRRIKYHHPTYTPRQADMQGRHADLACANNTSFCGAYWGYGFHEDGVRSAQLACDAMARHFAREEAGVA